MLKNIKSITLCGKPRDKVFASVDKYLLLQKHMFDEVQRPVSECDSYFLLVKGGTGQIIINGVGFELKRDTFCWIQSYHVVTIEPTVGEALELWVCVCDYQLCSYLTFSAQTEKLIGSVVATDPVFYPEGEFRLDILRLFDEFDHINDMRDCGTSLIKASILGELTALAMREGVHANEQHRRVARPVGWNAALYIATFCTEQITAADTAECCGVDIATLNRELRLATGQNFAQTLNRARINMAITGILFDGLSFAFLASYCGFGSEVEFYRNFKALVGDTPKDYQAKIQSDGSGDRVYRRMILNETLLAAVNYLHENYAEPLDYKTMAKKLYSSESIIRKLITDNFNMSYRDILTQFRVRYAESLLALTDLPILDISIVSGFNSNRTFTRVFVELNKQTPSDYRKECRGGREA